MALFRKKSASREASYSAPDFDPSHWIGRKFRSERTIDESVEIFDAVKAECYRITGPQELTWTVPEQAHQFQSSQGSATTIPPRRLVSYGLTGGGRITLALWDGMVSYGSGSGEDGPPREMWFVPTGFDTSPLPISGRWKMADPSLSSIGWVESPLWGAGS